ncbi:MAG: hypothetical protein ABL927_14130, partial [Bdellovibrionales bacterium]
ASKQIVCFRRTQGEGMNKKSKLNKKTKSRTHDCIEHSNCLNNESGQGLIEYLILTALLAVATMGVVRIMGESVAARFTDMTHAIQGGSSRKIQVDRVNERYYKKKDMGDFMQGATE